VYAEHKLDVYHPLRARATRA